MTTTRLAIYGPPDRGLPLLAVVIDDGEVLACEAVKSTAEAETLLEKVRENLPEFVAEARHPRPEPSAQPSRPRRGKVSSSQ